MCCLDYYHFYHHIAVVVVALSRPAVGMLDECCEHVGNKWWG
jgi:hypothetical protein